MTKPKYEIGNIINGWKITDVFRYDYYPGWVYSLTRPIGKSAMCLTLTEASLIDMLVKKSANVRLPLRTGDRRR
ncbi:MAG: hypothetical protein AAF383_19765 [Cyanobacteria bacterium P01_A01_bin.83]